MGDREINSGEANLSRLVRARARAVHVRVCDYRAALREKRGDEARERERGRERRRKRRRKKYKRGIKDANRQAATQVGR